ncbi:DUF421 domain-containing protein [Aeoliella sp. SH292]|uniref:DUF421 domain-containing protein n=1 Tax=Aeoliella sp. SH292 TaxID=3454464 RepID=UPI003F9A8848
MDDTAYTFDLHRILLGDHPPIFLLEIAARTVIIFLYTLLLLRCMGKRGMGNLTPFEFAIIVALGSAVGDPMFQSDVPLLHCMLVITLIVGMQRGMAMLSERNAWAEKALSSTPTILIVDGVIQVENLYRESYTHEELLEALRLNGVAQLGEVRIAYLEPSGELSVLRREQAGRGLSVEPERLDGRRCPEDVAGECCCGYCGLLASDGEWNKACKHCGHRQWVAVTTPKESGRRESDVA